MGRLSGSEQECSQDQAGAIESKRARRGGYQREAQLVAKAEAGTYCYEEDALRADSKAARVSEHCVRPAAVGAAANSRAGQHGEHAILEHTDAVVSGVCNVDASVGRDCDTARIEEGGRWRFAQHLLR